MYLIITDYVTPQKLAEIYTGKSGQPGVNRNHIYELIKREMKKPGTTTIDVMEIDGKYFVKLKNQTEREAKELSKNRDTIEAIEAGRRMTAEARRRAEAITATKDHSKKGKSSKGL